MEVEDKENKDYKDINGLRAQVQKFYISPISQFPKINKAILIMGTTRTGKSALYLIMQNIPLVSLNHPNKKKTVIYQAKQEGYKNIIGQESDSMTKIPNIAQLKIQGNPYLIDCPGLLDSQGFQDVVSNSYFIYKIFKVVESVRFLLCIEQNFITEIRITSIDSALTGFIKYFNRPSHMDEIIKHTSLVITKCEMSYQQIQTELKAKRDYYVKKDDNGAKKYHIQLLNNFINNRLIYLSNKLSQVGQQPSLNQLQIAKNQSKKPFYKMNFQQDISFTIQATEIMHNALALTQKMNLKLQDLTLKVGLIIQQAINEIVMNIGLEQNKKTAKYKDKIKTFVSENDIYLSKNNLQKRKEKLKIKKTVLIKCITYFRQIILAKMVDQAIKDLPQQQNTQILNNLAGKYFQYILDYGYAQTQNTDGLFNLAYIFQRISEEKIMLQIVNTKITPNIILLKDKLILEMQFRIPQKQDLFIQSFKVLENQDFQYLNYVGKFFEVPTNVQPKMISGLNFVEGRNVDIQKKRKEILAKVNSVAAENHTRENNVKQSINCYQKSRQMFQNLYESLNTQKFVKFENNIYKSLASAYLKIDQKQLAIQYFKVIRFEEEVKSTFEKLRNSKSQGSQKIKIMIVQAQYLASICLPFDAKNLLAKAFQESTNQTEKSQILNKMKDILANAQKVKQDYNLRITNSDFYNRPNNTLIQTLIGKIKK